MQNPFASLNKAVKEKKPRENRRLRHPQESEIINLAMVNLSQSEVGKELIDFVKNNDIKVTILRGRESRDYAPSDKTVYLSVSDEIDIHDPAITIHLAGAIRETAQEYDTMLRRVGVDRGESIYVHREAQKFEDKLYWQTALVYELGKVVGKLEFIHSFAIMGYASLVDAYEHDLLENEG